MILDLIQQRQISQTLATANKVANKVENLNSRRNDNQQNIEVLTLA